MKARCALIILNRVAKVFPNQYEYAKKIQKKIESLVESKDGKNQDLKTLAGRLNERLKQQIEKFPEHQAELNAKKKERAALEAANQEEESKRSKNKDNAANGNTGGSSGSVRRVNDNTN